MTYSNRIKVEATAGLGDATLGTPIDSFVAFPDGSTSYTILSEDDQWETGTGTVSDNLLTRLVVEENHLGNTDFVDFTGLELQIAQTISGGNYNRKPDVFHQKDAPTEYRVGDIWLPKSYSQLFVARGDIPITDEFVIVMRTTTDSETITLPATGTNNFEIDWGDDTVEQVTTVSPTHEYATAGDHTIAITGQCSQWYFNNGGDKDKLITVNNLGVVGWEGLNFLGCINLLDLNIGNTDTTLVTSLNGFTSSCISITMLDLGNLNTSNVIDMSNVFADLRAIVNTPDLTNLNTESVNTMNGMFRNWYLAETTPNLSSFNTENVTDMSSMLSGWHSCINPPIVSSFNTGSVTNMRSMFSNLRVATSSPDLSSFRTHNVNDMSNMMENWYQVTSPPDLSEFDTSKVTNMSRMMISWNSCTIPPDLSSFDTALVENFSSFMNGFIVLQYPPDLSSFNTESATNMSGMFADWRAISEMDIPIDTWDITKCTNMSNFIVSSSLSTECYDRTLIAWAAQAVQPDVVAHFGNSKYSTASAAARDILTINNNWTITDGGPA